MERTQRKLEYESIWKKRIRGEVDKGGFARIASKIGAGELGVVYKIKRQKGQEFDLAVKIQDDSEIARAEIEILKNPHDQPNLGYILDSFSITRKGWIWSSKALVTVMPFMDGGVLIDHFNESPEAYTRWIFYIVYQFQHTFKMSHCDSHLQNFMLKKAKQDETRVVIAGKTIVLPETKYTLFLFDPVSGAKECHHGNYYYDYYNCVDSYLDGRLLSETSKAPPKFKKRLERIETKTFQKIQPRDANGKAIPHDKFVNYTLFTIPYTMKKSKTPPEKVFLQCFQML